MSRFAFWLDFGLSSSLHSSSVFALERAVNAQTVRNADNGGRGLIGHTWTRVLPSCHCFWTVFSRTLGILLVCAANAVQQA